MFDLIKKDFLSFSKSKTEWIELLLTPFLLILILGFALGNLITNTSEALEPVAVALVNEQNTEADLSQLQTDLLEKNYPEEQIQSILSAAETLDPEKHLIGLLEDEEIKELIEIIQLDDLSAAETALSEDEIGGIIRIPEHFSLNTWRTTLLDTNSPSTLDITVQDLSQMQAIILENVVEGFSNEFNLQASIGMGTGEEVAILEERQYGDRIQLSTEEPVNSFQYYTIGMGVFYALAVGTILASKSFREKEQHVFARIMLAGKSPMTYLLSKLATGTILTFLQLVILFVLSTLIFQTFSGKDSLFWRDTLIVTFIYSLLCGGIASLLSSISLRVQNSTTIGFFSSFAAVFAFLGGSFTPIDTFSETLKVIGNWTPNGAALTSYIQLMMGFSLEEVIPLLVRILGMAVILILIAAVVFPKRRLD